MLDYLYEREMVTGVYIPRWLKAETALGRVQAISFVVDQRHERYTGRLSFEDTLQLVRQGIGSSGRCLDYLDQTVTRLEGLGICPGQLKPLLAAGRAAER